MRCGLKIDEDIVLKPELLPAAYTVYTAKCNLQIALGTRSVVSLPRSVSRSSVGSVHNRHGRRAQKFNPHPDCAESVRVKQEKYASYVQYTTIALPA